MITEKKSKTSPESIVREIKRRTRRKFTAEEKIRIVLEGWHFGEHPLFSFFLTYVTHLGQKRILKSGNTPNSLIGTLFAQ